MEDLKAILAEIANNDSFRELPKETETFKRETDSLFSGFPGDPDQFYKLNRPAKTFKKESDQEFEDELLKKIHKLNDVIFDHQADRDFLKNAHNKIGLSIQDLALIISKTDSEIYMRAHSKFRILSDLYDQMGDLISGTKQRKSKKPDVELTQTQIALLFYHLQKLGILDKNVSKSVLSKSIADATGFSHEKIRQELSHVEIKSNNIDSDVRDTDYHAINRKIKALYQSLEEDFVKRFKTE